MRVTTFVFPQMSAFHLSVPALIFGTDRSAIGMPSIDYRLAALDGMAVALPNGLFAQPHGGLSLLASSDLAIIPSWGDLDAPIAPDLAEALHTVVAGGGRVVGLCLGSYALAASGLLDGRTATTHWAWADHFRSRFPKVNLDAAALYVDAGPCVTSAGVAASLDACLHLVRGLSGEAVAARLARSIVMAPHRPGGQAQFIERPLVNDARSGRLATTLAQIATDAGRHWSLDMAAETAGMTRRSFTRHLRAQTGQSFSGWLMQRRIALACELLERTSLPIDVVADKSGFGTAANLRVHFARHTGLSPSGWRAQYAGRPVSGATHIPTRPSPELIGN